MGSIYKLKVEIVHVAVPDTKYSDKLHLSVLYFPLAKLISVDLCLFQHNSLASRNSMSFMQ